MRNASASPDKRQTGLTLLEIVIAMTIASLLAGLAIPAWRSFIIRGNRTDAITALARIESRQESFFLQHGRYAVEDERAVPPPAGLGIASTEHGYYTLALTPDRENGAGYIATATALSAERQASDERCWRFGTDASGARSATARSGEDTTTECWP